MRRHIIQLIEDDVPNGLNKKISVDASHLPDVSDIVSLYAGKHKQDYIVLHRKFSYSAYHGNNKTQKARDASITLYVQKV